MSRVRNLARLLTILVLIVGTIGTFKICGKVIQTGSSLIVLNDNASYYNEQARKTDEMTAEYMQNHEERQKFYNSEDPIIKGYSNSGTFAKVLYLLLAIAMFPGVALVWLYIIQCIYFNWKRKQMRRKKMQRKQEIVKRNQRRV